MLVSETDRRVRTYSYTIPVFVDHHHTQEHTEGEEEQPIDVVLDGVADRHAESEQENLGDGEESSAKNNVTDGPSVVEGAEDKNKLRDNIDNCADERP